MRGGFLTQPHASRAEDAEASQEGRTPDPPPKRAGHWSWKNNKAQESKAAASAEPRLGSGAGAERHASQPGDSTGVDKAGTAAQDRRADNGFEHVVQRDLLAGRATPKKESKPAVRDAAKHDSLQADADGPQNGKKAGGSKVFSSWAGRGGNVFKAVKEYRPGQVNTAPTIVKMPLAEALVAAKTNVTFLEAETLKGLPVRPDVTTKTIDPFLAAYIKDMHKAYFSE